MLNREDPGRQAVKRFEKAVFELSIMDKKTYLLRTQDQGVKDGFRQRIAQRQQQNERKEPEHSRHLIEAQFRWLKDMKLHIAEPVVLLNDY
jgi:aminoglycoside phosphotransferase (APT) family kinase protein